MCEGEAVKLGDGTSPPRSSPILMMVSIIAPFKHILELSACTRMVGAAEPAAAKSWTVSQRSRIESVVSSIGLAQSCRLVLGDMSA